MMTRISVGILSMLLVWMGGVGAAQQSSGSNTPARAVTFHKDVVPILQKNCQGCHRPGQVGPFSMLTYKEARPWAKAMKAAVSSRAMPPWFADRRYGHFNNDRSLTQAEIDTIVSWVDGGGLEGDAKDAPAPIQWADGGLQIKPDVVVDLPQYDVPATGVIEWVRIAFPAPFKEDTWVTSVEIMPGAPEVVHHLCMALVEHVPTRPYNEFEWIDLPRDEDGVTLRNTTEADGVIYWRKVGSTEVKRREGRSLVQHGGNHFCYLPGLPYEDYRPVSAGVFVPAGSDMTVSFHYTPNGLAVTDRSKIGFTVTKTPPAKRVLHQGGDEETDAPVARKGGIQQLAIPPFEASYVAPLTVTNFLRDVELVWFRPHAHQRGKSVQYKLFYPDGREEIVLNVPKYDFNWQLTYRTSIQIPKGSRIETQFVYDNSTSNRYNPNPAKWVYYGNQSWEEMGTANMGFLIPNSVDPKDVIQQR
jgi:hypothetical protein